jgi:tetratricopeptide (TPR) repeat protein
MNRNPDLPANSSQDSRGRDLAGQVDKLISLASRLHSAGRLAEEADTYRKILDIKPNWAEAHNYLGSLLYDLRKLDLAIASYLRALTLRPDFAEAHNNLGNALRDQGQFERAVNSFERALALRPDYAAIHINLGNALQDQKKYQPAVASYLKALALKPDFAVAHNNLGNALSAQGQFDQAVARYRQALLLEPGYADAHANLGNVLKAQGQLEPAITSYQRALALKPDFADARYNLANALKDQGRLDLAAAEYRQTLALKPDLAAAYNNLGNVLKQQGQLREAMTRFEQAIAIKPDLAEAHSNLGSLLKEFGKLDESVAQLKQALALKPDFAEAHNNLGNALKDLGSFEEAMASFDAALALDPDLAEAHSNRADLKKFCPGDADLTTLEALADSPDRLPAEKMVHVHFALGKALDDIGEYDQAFAQWLQGNRLKRHEVAYDEAEYQRNFRLITDTFDSKLFDRFPAVGDPSPTPIFVLGMPRSGSTLVEQILSSHPHVYGAGELKTLTLVANMVLTPDRRPAPYPSCISLLDSDAFRHLGKAYLAGLPRPPAGKFRVVDKTPVNYVYIGLIRLILPNARIIHTARDPIDTCLSCFSKLFSSGQPFTYDLAELGRYYRQYSALMDHWRSVLPAGAMLDVGYEDVVENLEEQARLLIDYCGLPWDDSCLSFHKTRRPVTTASNVQVRQPLYRSSVTRWRRYEAHLRPLLAALAGDSR